MAKMNQIAELNANPSNKWLLVVLLLTVLATAWTAMRGDSADENSAIDLVNERPSGDKSRPIERSSALNQAAEQTESLSGNGDLIPWQKLKREPLKYQTPDLFKVHSWVVVPPVKKVKAAPLLPPVAPPAPFEYLGKYENSPKGALIFLMANNKLYSVNMGEKIDSQWRLDSEDANALRLTYMPLGLPQILSKSAKLAAIAPKAAMEVNQ